MKFGEKIKYLRNRRGLSAKELAGLLDISLSFLSYLENGTRKASPGTLRKMVEVLDVPMDYLTQDHIVNLEEYTLSKSAVNFLNEKDVVNYMAAYGKAKNSGITAEELNDAIDFLIKMKKSK